MAERHIGYLIKQINERIKQCADRDMEWSAAASRLLRGVS